MKNVNLSIKYMREAEKYYREFHDLPKDELPELGIADKLSIDFAERYANEKVQKELKKKVETKISYNLTAEDLKQAVVEYMDKHHKEDFCLKEIKFETEMSDPDTFGYVTAICSRIEFT